MANLMTFILIILQRPMLVSLILSTGLLELYQKIYSWSSY